MAPRRRRFPRIALALAGGLVVAALLWWAFGVSALVKYPTDLDASPRYEGTFSLLVDPRRRRRSPSRGACRSRSTGTSSRR